MNAEPELKGAAAAPGGAGAGLKGAAAAPRPTGAGLLVLTALGLEARAVRRALPGATVVDVGMGPKRAARGAREALEGPAGAAADALAVAGFCGALDPSLKPGTVVVASEVRRAAAPGAAAPVLHVCASAPLIAAGLRARGIEAATGPLLCLDHVAGRAERADLWAGPGAPREGTRAIAVDMESAWMLDAALPGATLPGATLPGATLPGAALPGATLPGATLPKPVAPGTAGSGAGTSESGGDRPVAVLRVVVDDHEHGLVSPRTPGRSLRAWTELRRAAPVLAEWAAATRVPAGRRTVLLASPRSFFAGVEQTQTTLALDETAGIIDRLRERSPALESPPNGDICSATQNRKDALAAIAPGCDVVLVVAATNSSTTQRLVELSERLGTPAHLIDEPDLQLGWLAGRRRVGITVGAPAPDALVDRVVAALRGLGPVAVSEGRVTEESVRFAVPKEVS